MKLLLTHRFESDCKNVISSKTFVLIAQLASSSRSYEETNFSFDCWKDSKQPSSVVSGCCAWPLGRCWQLLSSKSLPEKMNHGGKTFYECVRFTRGAKKSGYRQKYSSPANQATMGNIKWVILSWAGLFRQCVCLCVKLDYSGWILGRRLTHFCLSLHLRHFLSVIAQSSSHKQI